VASLLGELAITLGGGGARAAYQAGVLRSLARRFPDLTPPILTGVSAGAINVAHLANHTSPFSDKVDDLVRLWSSLDTTKVFATHPLTLVRRAVLDGLRLSLGSWPRNPPLQGLLDTTPLRRFLHGALGAEDGALRGVAENLAAERLKAVALTATSYTTGQTLTFFAGRGIEAWERPLRRSVEAELTVEHVMASAALPIFFPAIKVGDAWHGDGGIRLTAPLAPALHLGAGRILTVSTHYRSTHAEADRPAFEGPPSLAQVMGILYNAIFLDHLDHDALQLARINRILGALPPEGRMGLREVKLLVLRPSRDLDEMANEFEPRLPWMFRYLTRRLGTRRASTQHLLSTVLFQSDYLGALIELGERDADARAAEIDEFVGGPQRTGSPTRDRP